MKIKTNTLSKNTLVWIVENFRPRSISDLQFAKITRMDLIKKLYTIDDKQKNLLKKMKSLKCTVHSSSGKLAEYNKLVKQHNQLNIKGQALLEQLKKLEKHYPGAKVTL